MAIYEAKEKKFVILPYSSELVEKYIDDLMKVDMLIAGYPSSTAVEESKEINGEEKWTLKNFQYPLKDKEKLSRLVIFGDKCIGFMFASTYEKKSHLSRIAILDEFQGHGLGKELMRILEIESKALGLKELTLSTLYKGEEDKVVKFYERLGYKVFKTEEKVREFLKNKNKESDFDLFWPIESGKLIVMSRVF